MSQKTLVAEQGGAQMKGSSNELPLFKISWQNFPPATSV